MDPNIPLISLTAEQKAVVCDWAMDAIGGYGAGATCADGSTIKNYDNQAQCVAVGLNYACEIATVGNLASCVTAQAPSRGCSRPRPQCDPLYCS